MAGADEDRVRAAPERLGAAHRGVNPERASLVVRGRDDAAPVRVAAHDQRLGAELRLFQLLDRGEEGIQVEVRDDQASTHSSLRRIATALPPCSIPSSSTSGPPIMKSVWMLDTFDAPSGSSTPSFRVKPSPPPYAM